MIKLESSNKTINEAFYFNTIEECERFKYVFSNHWTGVKWKTPVEINECDIPYDKIRYIKRFKSPEEYAEDNLKWGFNSLFIEEPKLSKQQESFIQMMIHRVTN